MHSITQRTLLTVLLVLEFCQSLSDKSKLSIFSNRKRNIPSQKRTQFSKGKQQMQNKLFVNSELKLSNGEKRGLTITRVQKDNMTIDTVKVDDPKKPEMIPVKVYHDDVKTDKGGQRVQNILVPNVQLSKLQLSPQQKLPSKPSRQKSTKPLDRQPALKPVDPVGPVAPVVQPTQVTNQCFNGTICIERICFHPTLQCQGKAPTGQLGIPPPTGEFGIPPPTEQFGIPPPPVLPSSTKLIPSTTPTIPTCCSCPGICVDVNLCVKQLPICSALPRCATGQCAQNCCGR